MLQIIAPLVVAALFGFAACKSRTQSDVKAAQEQTLSDGYASAEASTKPTAEVSGYFANARSQMAALTAKGKKVTKKLVYDVMFKVSSSGAIKVKAGPLAVQFKRNKVDNPFAGLDPNAVESGAALPDFALVDNIKVSFGFPLGGSIPVPSVPGLTAGLNVGVKGALELSNLRTFYDPEARGDYGLVSNATATWAATKLIPQWISDNRVLYDKMKACKESEKLNYFSSYGNMLTFPIALPFNRANIKTMFEGDVYSYGADGTISFGGSLSEGPAKLAANVYATGQWKVTLQKVADTKMRVMVAEIEGVGVSNTLDVRPSLVVYMTLKAIDQMNLRLTPRLEHSFVKVNVGARSQNAFRRIYEYDIGNDETNPAAKKAFDAYLQALTGRLDVADNMIAECEAAKNKNCPVTWVKDISGYETEASASGKVSLLVADVSQASKIKFADNTVTVDAAEVHTYSNIVRHDYNNSRLGFTLRWTNFHSIPVPVITPNRARVGESFIFATEFTRRSGNTGGAPESETSILGRWNYADTEVTKANFDYLDDFFDRILAFATRRSSVMREYFKFINGMDPTQTFRSMDDIPFQATLQIGILPKLFDECLQQVKTGDINLYMLLYKAFLSNPATEVPAQMQPPSTGQLAMSSMPMDNKVLYPSTERAVVAYLHETDPEKRVDMFSNLVKYVDTAPEMLTFFAYLATAGINNAERNLLLDSVFEGSSNVSMEEVNRKIAGRLSTFFSIKSGQLAYSSDINGQLFSLMLESITDKSTSGFTDTPQGL